MEEPQDTEYQCSQRGRPSRSSEEVSVMEMVKRHTEEQWIILYVERWLKTPFKMQDGTIVERTAGTPQGGVISPVLANLFMHYVFDDFMYKLLRLTYCCKLHRIYYSSDENCIDEDNIKWMNDLEQANDNKEILEECIMFLSDFHSPKNGGGAWNADSEYTQWQLWLARSKDGKWKLMTWGY